jgi:hypothetical protein
MSDAAELPAADPFVKSNKTIVSSDFEPLLPAIPPIYNSQNLAMKFGQA